MKKIFLLIHFIICIFVLFSLNAFSQVPNWQWAKTATTSPSSIAYSICTDASGNSYAAGRFQYPSISFGSITLNSNGPSNDNLFLVKYDPSGNVLWAKNAGGVSQNLATSVAADNSGNVFIAGTFSDTIIFGSTTLIYNSPGGHMFLAKYDCNGNVLWAKKTGSSHLDQVLSVATDASGNCYMTGSFQGTLTTTFDSFTLTNASNGQDADIFLVKYDPSGNALWAKGYGGNSQAISYSVTTDPSGNSYITGRFTSSITFGITTLPYWGTFLVKSDPSGTVVWAKCSTGTTTDCPTGNSVSTDELGNSYITGYFNGPSVIFGSHTLNNSDNSGSTQDLFQVKYGPSGNVLWAKSAGGISDQDVGTSVFADSIGNSYFTGYYASSTITFGSTILTSNGPRDIFIVKYGPSGNVLWAKSAGGISTEDANSIAVDLSGNCYIAGEFYSPIISFGSTTLTNGGNGEMFIAKTGNVEGINSAELVDNYISAFPNPASNNITIQFSEISSSEITITDQLGKEIIRQKINGEKQIEISVADLADGMYFYQVVQKDNIKSSGKFIVQH